MKTEDGPIYLNKNGGTQQENMVTLIMAKDTDNIHQFNSQDFKTTLYALHQVLRYNLVNHSYPLEVVDTMKKLVNYTGGGANFAWLEVMDIMGFLKDFPLNGLYDMYNEDEDVAYMFVGLYYFIEEACKNMSGIMIR